MTPPTPVPGGDLLCFSHLGWDFVFQRPQHLMSRAAKHRRTVFWEEPVWLEHTTAGVEHRISPEGVMVARPRLPWGADYESSLRRLLDQFLASMCIDRPILWYYAPQFLEFTGHLEPSLIVYDCMDELSAFEGADTFLPEWERRLLARADLVFTGGQSLYEAKRTRHASVHAFPSGVDAAHFRPARAGLPEPAAQRGIGPARAGFFGVIDERFDRDLLAAVADLLPAVQFVMVGPIVKIGPELMPARANIHYIGPAPYAELPAHVAQWQVALMPFALNAATRFISPTKTPEYLAAGRPVVSTPITDVVRQYGAMTGVWIAPDAARFAAAITAAMALPPESWWPEADLVLDGMAWDTTWRRMSELIDAARPAVLAAE